MKMKYILIFTILCLLLNGCLCSCSQNEFSNADLQSPILSVSAKDKVEKELDSIIEAIEANDKESIKNLFSYEVRNTDMFETQVERLIEFYCGTRLSVSDITTVESRSIRMGEDCYICEYSVDVLTTENTYRIAVRCCIEDTECPDNVGIQSFYIIEAQETNPQFTYWGDSEWKLGINIERQENTGDGSLS